MVATFRNMHETRIAVAVIASGSSFLFLPWPPVGVCRLRSDTPAEVGCYLKALVEITCKSS